MFIKRNICSIEHPVTTSFHELIPTVSLVVSKEPHLLSSVCKLCPLGRRDQGVGNATEHLQVAQVWLLAIPQLMGTLSFQRGVRETIVDVSRSTRSFCPERIR